MSLFLCIVRHGETDWNKLKKCQGQTDIGLNENGLFQENLLLKELIKKDFDIILSSPLQRTMSTALKLSKLKNIEYIKYDFLKERKLGKFESYTLKEIKKKWPLDAEMYINKNINFTPTGGESLIEFYQRVVNGFKLVLENYKNKNIIIFTHAGVINCLYHYVYNIDISQFGGRKIPNASYTNIRIEEKIEILEESITKHLPNETLNEVE